MEAFETWRNRPGEATLLALLQAHQDTVYNLCHQVLRHPQDAQDAAQKVFLDLLIGLPRITDGKHFVQWLHRASFHVALNMKQGAGRRVDRERRAAKMEISVAPQETHDTLHAHIAALEGD